MNLKVYIVGMQSAKFISFSIIYFHISSFVFSEHLLANENVYIQKEPEDSSRKI